MDGRTPVDKDGMDEVELLVTCHQLIMLAEAVEQINVEGFLKCTESSEGTVRTLLSNHGQRSLGQMRALARGALVFKSALPPVESDKETGSLP